MAYGDILLAGRSTFIYRYSNGSWDTGFAGPSGENDITGLTIDPKTGFIFAIGNIRDRIYKYSNGSWDTGFAGPSGETNLQGIAINPITGAIYGVGNISNKVYTYLNGVWDTGFAGPSRETIAGLNRGLRGITYDLTLRNILVVGTNRDRIYRYSNGSWDTGFAVPTVESKPFGVANPAGLAINPRTEAIYIIGNTRDRIYKYSNGSWDTGFAVPSGAGFYQGLTIDTYQPNKNIAERISIQDSILSSLAASGNENIAIVDSIDIQVVYGSEATQQEFELLSKWYVRNSLSKEWVIPGGERPAINNELTNNEPRYLTGILINLFGDIIFRFSSYQDGSVSSVGDDLSDRFELNGNIRLSAADRVLNLALNEFSDLEEPYTYTNATLIRNFWQGIAGSSGAQSGKLILSNENIVESISENEVINIHEAVTVGREIEELENIAINEEVVTHILKNLSEDIGILENIILDVDKHISENIRIQDGIATLILEPVFDLDKFNKVGLNIFALAFITAGTPEGNGTVFRVSNNLGSVSADSDLEVTDNRNITRVAMEPSGAGTIRIWDTPSILTWTNFFATNPTATLRVQFSSIGPAYELTRGRQGGNFSNWSTSNTDARTAIHNARASGQKFILALASPGLNLIKTEAERINIIDSIHTQLARIINKPIQEQIIIQDAIDIQLIRHLVENISEQINIQDAIDIQLIRHLVENIAEQIHIVESVNIISGVFWPSTLPSELSRRGYAETPMDNTIIFKTSYGSGMRRPRYTSTPILYSCTILLTDAEYVIFKDFYFNTIKAGSINFVFPKLLTSQNTIVRFVSKPSRKLEGKKWRISLALRTV